MWNLEKANLQLGKGDSDGRENLNPPSSKAVLSTPADEAEGISQCHIYLDSYTF